MYQIEICWDGCWVVVRRGFATQDDAEWAAAKWKHENDCRGDPFRAVKGDQKPALVAAAPQESAA